MRLLIIEDNIDLCSIVKKKLEGLSYQVDVTYNGKSGEMHIWDNAYDLILLDLNLPDMDGMEVLSFMRKHMIHVPVIILTGKDDLQVKLQGFALGADDYIEKPFDIRELEARMQAVIRRSRGKANAITTIGDISLDMHKKKIYCKDKELIFTNKEYEILEYIILEHPRIVSSEELMEHVYNEYADPFSSALRVQIVRIRKKLMEAANKEILITYRGKGYSL